MAASDPGVDHPQIPVFLDRNRQANAARPQNRVETASNERVQALLVSMALIWARLADEAEQIEHTKLGVADDDIALH